MSFSSKRQTIAALVAILIGVEFAVAGEQGDAELFGDIFAHPRDRHYLPGAAPSRAEFDSIITDYSDERGEVSRWEYRKDNRVITREVWTDESGEPKARLGIGRNF